MTPATDDDALEAAFEAFLAGRSAPSAAEGLVAFADGVRASAARPPRPNAALADLLATGLLTDQSSAAAAPAPAPRRRRSRMFLPTALAKLASAGIAAKAATVAGVVVVGVSTAGFTHTLPGAVQTTFNQVVTHDETADGTTQSGTTGTTTTGTTTTGTSADGTTGTGTGTGGATGTSTDGTTDTSGTVTSATTGDGAAVPVQQAPAGNGLGSTVSGNVDHGSVGGVRVSDLAHQRNDVRRAGASSGTGTGTTGDAGSTATTGGDDSTEHESGDDSTTSAGSGSGTKGKGHSNG